MKDVAALENDELNRGEHAPPGWTDAQDSLAAASGLSLLLVSGPQPPALAVSNNNSICQAFQSSAAHAHLCEPYCGKAFERATRAASATTYRCHAGLNCVAIPVEAVNGRKLAVIGGRAFLTGVDYRALAERFCAGDLRNLLSEDLFKNVIFAARQDLEDLTRRLNETLPVSPVSNAPAVKVETVKTTVDVAVASAPPARAEAKHDLKSSEESKTDAREREKAAGAARTELFQNRYFASETTFEETCGAALRAFTEKHKIASLALLLRGKAALETAFALGGYAATPIHIEIGSKDARLALMAKAGSSLALRETAEGFKPQRSIAASGGPGSVAKMAELFPLVVGEDVKGALLVGHTVLDEAKRRAISNFCRDIAMPLEVLRLRYELDQKARFADCLQNFTERINAVEPAETYRSILRHSSELLRAERSSLLLFDEASNELSVKAALGRTAEVASDARVRLGEGVSGSVLREGRPLVVRDLETSGRTPAPLDHRYKTNSFISYPIIIGGRKVGVLNVTDKAGGGFYDDVDLVLLEVIAPQMALALDRAEWHEKAAQFQLMSITDPLTGLLNRRYLEERLSEELNRSKRENFAMSFLMLDIDDFKLYNDRNGHQAGDVALEMTAQCLRSALRSADVAARYGGEEFCILLPQTNFTEASAIAERIRRRVERTRYPHGKTQPLGAVTISIGLSVFSPTLDTPKTIIGAADRALYLAKSHGKNRVEPKVESEVQQPTSDEPEKSSK